MAPLPPRSCQVCGARVTNGTARCDAHQGQRFSRPASCQVCGIRSAGQYCEEHKPLLTGNRPQAEREQRQPWRKGYRSPTYHREKQAVLNRAGGKCERCKRSDLKLEVDHIIPLSSAQSEAEVDALNTRANLRALCVMCHRSKRQWDK